MIGSEIFLYLLESHPRIVSPHICNLPRSPLSTCYRRYLISPLIPVSLTSLARLWPEISSGGPGCWVPSEAESERVLHSSVSSQQPGESGLRLRLRRSQTAFCDIIHLLPVLFCAARVWTSARSSQTVQVTYIDSDLLRKFLEFKLSWIPLLMFWVVLSQSLSASDELRVIRESWWVS